MVCRRRWGVGLCGVFDRRIRTCGRLWVRVAFAQPGDFGSLLFRFAPGEQAYQNLVGQPGLTASVSMDRSSCQFWAFGFQSAVTNAELVDVLAKDARDTYRPPPLHMYSSLMRPVRPSGPRKPPTLPTTGIVPAELCGAPEAVEDKNPEEDLPQVPMWLLRADISVWRSRWLWRLVASLWVRRTEVGPATTSQAR
jgi:hypothetical protein